MFGSPKISIVLAILLNAIAGIGNAQAQAAFTQVTLWGDGASGWTNGTSDFGPACSQQVSGVQQAVAAYLKSTSGTIAVFNVRDSGIQCPYIDIVTAPVDAPTLAFLEYTANNSNVLQEVLSAADPGAVVQIAENEGFTINPSTISALNNYVPTTFDNNAQGRLLMEAPNTGFSNKNSVLGLSFFFSALTVVGIF